MTAALTIHPICALFPPLPQAQFAELCEDIRQHGLREPILLWDNQIIDGRHRYQACLAVGVTPAFKTWPGTGRLIDVVVSLNLRRRHLTESQRAMVAAQLETLAQGQRADYHRDANLHVCDRHDAAERLSVSPRSVANAAKVRATGAPELIAAVERGEVAVSTAAELSYLPADAQRQALTRAPGALRAIARKVKQRIHDAGVTGPSAVRLFEQLVEENSLCGAEQLAVVETIKAETPPLPTPTEARRIAQQGQPGLMVLASDGCYHAAPTDPQENARLERWLRLREGLEALATLPFPPAEALASIPPYQQHNVTEWLARAVPFLHQLNQLWSQQYA